MVYRGIDRHFHRVTDDNISAKVRLTLVWVPSYTPIADFKVTYKIGRNGSSGNMDIYTF